MMDPLVQLMTQLQAQGGIQTPPTPMTGGGGGPDFGQMMQRIQSLTPEQMNQAAQTLAARGDPPPAPGSLGQAVRQLQSFPGQQAGPQAMPPMRTQDPVQAGLETGQAQLQQQLRQQQGQGQGQKVDLGALLGALKQNEPPEPPPPAYISNLGFGAASPAQGLRLQAQRGGGVGGLGQYL